MHVFASHSFSARDRVRDICRSLTFHGVSVWRDETDMYGNIPQAMAHGIDSCSVVLLFLTTDYVTKVNSGFSWDNCYREFAYAMWSKKEIIPIVLDSELLDVNAWPRGIVPMTLSTILYIDGCTGPVDVTARQIISYMSRLGYPRKGIVTRFWI